MQHIVCFGDSLTQQGYQGGWISRLAAAYVRKATVVNCGLSGYNSRWYMDVLRTPEKRARLLPDYVREPLFATLLLGSNDLATNEQGVPLGEFIANMEAIVKLIHAEVKPRYGIFLLTPPPINEEVWRVWKQLETTDRTLTAARLYRTAVLDIAANFQKNHPEMRVHLVDMHSAILHYACPATARLAATDPKWEPTNDPQAPWTQLLVDGLHLNDVGGALFFSALYDAIRTSAFADELNPEKMPWLLPAWAEVVESEKRQQ